MTTKLSKLLLERSKLKRLLLKLKEEQSRAIQQKNNEKQDSKSGESQTEPLVGSTSHDATNLRPNSRS